MDIYIQKIKFKNRSYSNKHSDPYLWDNTLCTLFPLHEHQPEGIRKIN